MKKIILIVFACLLIAGCNNKLYDDFEETYNSLVNLKDNVSIEENTKEDVENKLDDLKEKIESKASEEKIKAMISSIKETLKSSETKIEEDLKLLEDKLENISSEKIDEKEKKAYETIKEEYEKLKLNKEYQKATEKIKELIKKAEESYNNSNKGDVLTDAITLSDIKTGIVNYDGGFFVKGTLLNTTSNNFSKVIIYYDVICTSGGEYKCGDYQITINDVKANEKRTINEKAHCTNLTAQYGGDELKFKKIEAYK